MELNNTTILGLFYDKRFSFTAYTLGIVATFVSLYLMKAAQPALLFLVPFTLVPVFIISWLRGDLAAMWRGDFAEVMIFKVLVF